MNYSNNNYLIEYNFQFKQLNYDEINNDLLIEIRQSLGINRDSYSTYNKSQNYELLSRYFEAKENLTDYKFQQDKREKENTFVSGIELAIKDISKLEKSFWSIFRNKILFKNIFSEFSKTSALNSYDRLININYILNSYSNGIYILKDKLKCSSYLNLDFKKARNEIFNLYTQTNQHTQNNIEIFNYLFKNYGNEWFSDYGKSIEQIISSGNIVAFKVFTSIYGIDKQAIEDTFNNTTHITDIKLIKEFHRLGFGKSYNGYFELKSYNHFKMLKYLKSLSPSVEINKINIDEFELFKETVTLKQLIKIDDYLLKSNGYQLNSTELESELKLKSTIQFTNDQLNQSLLQLLAPLANIELLESKDKDNTILNSITFHTAKIINKDESKRYITEFTSLPEHYIELYHHLTSIYYNLNDNKYIKVNNNENNQNNQNIIDSSNIKYQLKLNIYNIIKRLHSIQKFKSIFYYLFFKDQRYIKKINTQVDLDYIWGEILSSDNLDIIKYYSESTQGLNLSNIHFGYSIKLIKSIKVLDYLFGYFQDVFFKDKNNYFLFTSSLKLLQHYEKLMGILYRKFFFELNINSYLWKIETFSIVEKLLRAKENENGLYIEFNDGLSFSRILYNNFVNKDILNLLYSGKEMIVYKFLDFYKDRIYCPFSLRSQELILHFPQWIKNNVNVQRNIIPFFSSQNSQGIQDNQNNQENQDIQNVQNTQDVQYMQVNPNLVSNFVIINENGNQDEFGFDGDNDDDDEDDDDEANDNNDNYYNVNEPISLYITERAKLQILYSKGELDTIMQLFRNLKNQDMYSEIPSFLTYGYNNISIKFYQEFLKENNGDFLFNFSLLFNLPLLKYIVIHHSDLFLRNINYLLYMVIYIDSLEICQFLLNFITIKKDYYIESVKNHPFDHLLIYNKLYNKFK